MRHALPSSAALIVSVTLAAFLAGCASEPPPPPPPSSTVSVGPGASGSEVAPAPTTTYAPAPLATTTWQTPEGAIPAGRLTEPPIAMRQTRPVYPEDLRQTSTQGYAVVGFVVEPDGSVGYARTLSATNQEFGDAALVAVRSWGFQAGRLNGQLVKSYLEVPVYFTLTQPAPATVANPATPAESSAATAGTVVNVPIPPLPSGVYDVSEADQNPIPVSQPSPVYPDDMRRSGTEGYATVLFIVEADGSVSNILSVRATNSEFGDAAAAAVAQWKFQPAVRQGVPVRVRVLVPVQFQLND